MKALRLAGAVVIAGSLLLFSARATATASPTPVSEPCTASALTSQLSHVTSVQSYGCEGDWAYLWATLSVAGNQVSVTELMSDTTGTWSAVSRSTYCHAGSLPDLVYRRACFSN
ncbi:MAG TPA: hypothetical protein VFN54_04540 [Acidimicrobiales bacterium]|nr:hypothetical protein [Acidimicrobiales bacterium]